MKKGHLDIWRRLNRHIVRPWKHGEWLCHQWIGAVYGNGHIGRDGGEYKYGCLNMEGRTVTAHRLIYELVRGPIPEGLILMHMCDNPRCVNPAHLQLGTQKDNVHDMIRKGRARYRSS